MEPVANEIIIELISSVEKHETVNLIIAISVSFPLQVNHRYRVTQFVLDYIVVKLAFLTNTPTSTVAQVCILMSYEWRELIEVNIFPISIRT